MQVFLDHFAASLPEGVHAALLLDSAGRHTAGDIAIPSNVSFIFLPPYTPSLNPAERVWLYLRERYFSLRLFADLDDIIDGRCEAWNRLLTEPGRLATLQLSMPAIGQNFMRGLLRNCSADRQRIANQRL